MQGSRTKSKRYITSRQLKPVPFKRVYGGGIIRWFDKTPPDIVCPHFWELNWAYGCHFGCSYCYLQGTFHGERKPWSRPLSQVFETLDEFFQDHQGGSKHYMLNSGELTDSLVYPDKIRQISDKFEGQDEHKLLLLTKASNIGFLIERPRRQTVVSFSINAPKVSGLWERGAPSPEKRIGAAKKVSGAGYETRIRIDPMVPIKGWEKLYCDLVDQIFDTFRPSRITLGSLRGLQKTIMFCKDKSWTRYLSEGETGWGKKVGFALRLSMYSVILNHLKEKHGYSNVALCKETPAIWGKLGLDPKACRCNCMW